MVGFSIGAYIALMVSAQLSGRVRQLHLVSAAAPLASLKNTDDMAGTRVFKLAKGHPLVFSALTTIQVILARFAPATLVQILFSNTNGKDQELSKSVQFSTYIESVLRECFVKRRKGYVRDIHHYVNWQNGLNQCSAPKTYVWHGLDDNWAPFEMAEHLVEALPRQAELISFEGLSHYSSLMQAAALICERIATFDESQ